MMKHLDIVRVKHNGQIAVVGEISNTLYTDDKIHSTGSLIPIDRNNWTGHIAWYDDKDVEIIGNVIDLISPLKEPAPEPKCICGRTLSKELCHNCYQEIIEDAIIHSKAGYQVSNNPDPAPPLRAQVAKALGRSPIFHGGYWRLETAGFPADIPPYDTDIKEAMQALEEYCQKINCAFNVGKYLNGISIHINAIRFPIVGSYWCDIPEAICLAIVKHAEGK